MKGFLSGIGIIVVIGILAAGLYFGVPAVMRWGVDTNREVNQHSNAYVQSKTQELMGYITKYEDPLATSGQKQAIVNRFCYTVTLLIPEEWNQPIASFEREHC